MRPLPQANPAVDAAAYLPHHAGSREQRLQIARTVYEKLAPGQRIVASIAGPCAGASAGQRIERVERT